MKIKLIYIFLLGSTLLDYAISNKKDGGVPCGRIIEISGKEASGKSLIAYHILANCQKAGGLGIYIDTERAANREFMERMGIDFKKLWQPEKIPNSIEEVFTLIEKITTIARTKMKDKKKPIVVVWDSVAATTSASEEEVEYDQSAGMATEARAMSRGFRKILSTLHLGYVTLVCINQLREKIGVSFGDSDITPHGRALPFYSSVRIKLNSLGQIKDTKTERTIGVKTKAKVFKNKVGPNHRSVDFPLYFDWGVNDEISLLDFCVESGIVTGTTWKSFVYNGEEYKFQGTQKWVELLQKPEIKKYVLDKVDELMTVSFDRRPESIEIDTESLMEVDQLKSDLNK